MEFVKKYWLAIIAIIGLVWYVRSKRATVSTEIAAEPTNANGVPISVANQVASEARAWWPGATGDPAEIHPADQTLYPGYYQDATGGYFNPDTGASFSPGSSPPIMSLSAEEQAALDIIEQGRGEIINRSNSSLIDNAVPGSTGLKVIY